MNSLVSVIVPVYNSEKYISRCIENILKQTYPNIEIIIIDDGSNDKTKEIVDKYIKKNVIQYKFINNSGVSNARNCGIELSKGEYICFIDCDDYFDIDYIEILVDLVEKNRCDMGMCSYYVCEESANNKIKKVSKKQTYRFNETSKMLDSFLIPNRWGGYVWNKLFKKNIIIDYNIRFEKDVHISEDFLFLVNYTNYCKSIIGISEKKYHYVQNKNIKTKLSEKDLTLVDAYEKIIAMYNKYDCKCINELYYNFLKINIYFRNSIKIFPENKHYELYLTQLERNIQTLMKKTIYKNKFQKLNVIMSYYLAFQAFYIKKFIRKIFYKVGK